MADYIWTESAGTAEELMPRVVATKFGDGYEQRADDGLNPLAQVWDVVHTDVETVLANEIRDFVKAGLGRVNFNWVPPEQTTALKFKCTSFRRTMGSMHGFWNLSLRFEQVFEP